MPNIYAQTAHERIHQKIEEIKSQFGTGIHTLLQEVNKAKLKGKGKITAAPAVDQNTLRWTLAWKATAPGAVGKKAGAVSFELNIVVFVEDDGREARVAKVWVHRRASTPMEFEGHTPTTRMRRLAHLSLSEIREAIEAEWG